MNKSRHGDDGPSNAVMLVLIISVACVAAILVGLLLTGDDDETVDSATTTATVSAARTTIGETAPLRRTPTPAPTPRPRRTPTPKPTPKPTTVDRSSAGDDPVCARALDRFGQNDNTAFWMAGSGCEMRDGGWLPISQHAGWSDADYQCNQLSYEIESIVGENYPEHAFDPDVDALIALQDNSCQWDALDTGYWSAR